MKSKDAMSLTVLPIAPPMLAPSRRVGIAHQQSSKILIIGAIALTKSRRTRLSPLGRGYKASSFSDFDSPKMNKFNQSVL